MDFNPWWKKPYSTEYVQRPIYAALQPFLSLPQIVALTGLRRVGKTTLMQKIIMDSIQRGVDPLHIVYFSFDEFKTSEIRSILSEMETLNQKELSAGKWVVLLDEIQKVERWDEQLKILYDTFGKNVKFIIAGSESLFIRIKSKQTLAGRIFEFTIEPLTFSEYLSFKHVSLKPIGLYERELQFHFEEFIKSQGFPEMVGVSEKEVIQKYIKEGIMDKIIYQDIPTLFGIANAQNMEPLLHILMDEPGQITDLSKMAGELDMNRRTLSRYMKYLEEAFLVQKLYNFSTNARKTQRKLKKYYPSIISPELTFNKDSTAKSSAFEWILVRELRAEFFWRDPSKNEVDIIQKPKNPIEIKYGKVETSGMVAFMRKFGVSEGIILHPTREEKIKHSTKTIHVIPAYKYLLQKETAPTKKK